jgi:diguanylate cyclase (GGDEF)-like protein/putative nucleotidyltransferase with HDIG domain
MSLSHFDLTSRTATRLAVAGLAIVLLALAVVAVGGASETRSATDAARKAIALNEAYSDARSAVVTEESLERRYRIEPSAAVRTAHAVAARALGDALRRAAELDHSASREVATLITRERAYVAATNRMFDAVDAGQRPAAARIDHTQAEPVFISIEHAVNSAADAHRAVARSRLSNVGGTATSVQQITLAAFVIGLILLSACAAILLAQRRRVSESQAREIELLGRVATTDPLTGLRNHRAFQEDLTREAHRAERAGSRVALVMFDLDSLKELNDALGHQAGDDGLTALAQALHDAARASDAVYRVGGDEFTALLPDTDAWAASVFAQRVQLMLASDTASGASATAGVADALPPTDKDALIRRADLALLEAKRAHRPMLIYSTEFEPAEPIDRDLAVERARHHAKTLATALALAVDAKDPHTRSHSQTVSELSAQIAVELGLEPRRVAQVRLAGLLHDVGKIGIPDTILQKPAKLTDDEYELIKTHSTLGHKIVLACELEDEASWVLHHHERIDGLGYPDGQHEEDISLEARILAVADTYEAITSDRPYRAGQSSAAAFAELLRCAGSQFDPDCVDALRRATGEAHTQMSTEQEPVVAS